MPAKHRPDRLNMPLRQPKSLRVFINNENVAIAYARAPLTREVRAANAKVYINCQFTTKQQLFLDFVLSHYITVGVEELDQSKLTPLLRLAYHDSIGDAVADLGRPEEIGKLFTGFQKYLYQGAARAL